MKNLNKKFILIGLTIIVVGGFFLIVGFNNEEAKSLTTKNREKPQKVVVATKAIHFFNPKYKLSLPGKLKPYERVKLFAKVNGFVQKLNVDRGSIVKKGDVLAIVEAPEINQAYLAAKAQENKALSQLELAKQSYQRIKRAAQTQGAVAAMELDLAASKMESTKAIYLSAKANTRAAQVQKNYLKITAPFDGIITERNSSPGALVGINDQSPLFILAQGNRLRLTVALPEKHAGSVKNDMLAHFTVNARPDTTFTTTLSRYSRLVSPENHAVTLEFDFPNMQQKVQGGDYAQVELTLQRKTPSFWVPTNSVLHVQAGTFVMVKDNDKIRRIPIEEGIRLDSITEVFGDFHQKDKVVLKPNYRMR